MFHMHYHKTENLSSRNFPNNELRPVQSIVLTVSPDLP